MLSHTTLGVADVAEARKFYGPLLEALGLTLKFADERWAGWQHPLADRPLFIVTKPFDGEAASAGNGQMIALLASRRSLVDACYSLALALGATGEGAPGLRPDYHPDYYGAYFRDRDGNKLCVCCHQAEPGRAASPAPAMTIDPEIKADAERSVLCWLATVDATGTPNVTPKEIFSLYGDDRLLIADIASSNSVRNIHHHPPVCVSFVDVFRQRGFKLVGAASIVAPDDPDFPIVGAELLQMAGPNFPVRHIISVRIERASRIWAPSYRLFPDHTEEQRMRQAYPAYGVEPVERS